MFTLRVVPMAQIAAIFTILCSLLGVAAAAFAQTSFETASEYYEDASTRVSDGDYAAAIIQLRNALQLENDHLPSLLLLGKALLESGDPFEASLVLSDALFQGLDAELVLPLLIDAYTNAQQFNTLLNKISVAEAPRSLSAEVSAARAQAYLSLGRTGEARKELTVARSLDATNFRVQLADISLLQQNGSREEALSVSQQLTEQQPEDTRSWNSYASSLHALGRLEDAIGSYEQAVALAPGNTDARIALIDLLMELGRDDAAKPHIDLLREEYSFEPRGAYYSALYAARNNDRETERNELATAISLLESMRDEYLNNNPQLLIIGALATFGMQAHESAANYIDAYLSLRSEDPTVIRLKASNLLALGEAAAAIQTLLPLQQRNPRDIETASLLAAAYSANGEHGRAATLLSGIAGASDESSRINTQLGYALLNAGSISAGLQTLERVYAENPDREDIALQLAVAYVRAERYVDTLQLIETFPKAWQDHPHIKNLRAIALSGSGNPEDAEALYRILLADSENDLAALTNLATIERRQGNTSAAKELLIRAQQAHPDLAMPYIEQSKLELQLGDGDAALRAAERATELSADNNTAVWQLVRAHFATGNPDQAEEVARRHSARNSEDLGAAAILGQTFVQAEKPKQASLVYTQMSRQPDINADDLFRIAQLQLAIGDLDSAALSLSQALQRDAQNYRIRITQLQVELRRERYDTAQSMANALLDDFPGDPLGRLVLGEVMLAQNEPFMADKYFREAIDTGASIEGTLGRFRALQQLGKPAKAEAALDKMLQQPKPDLRIEAALTDLLVMEGRWEEAEPALTEILRKIPRSPAHLNNRAIVRLQLGRLADAEKDALAAIALEPDSANIQDTLGWILVESGRPGEALPYVREAAARRGSDPSIRYHLAATLAALGREREALTELYALRERGDTFPEWQQAIALENRLK
jgi:putative PEP-CTERM system TPR-repeat lipoprotein